jgi:phosphotransferase system enzyme I (PtsI)
LTQYALAVDRVNDQVNYLFQPCHPAILRLICQVVEAGERAGIPVTVCGEMAGDPLMTLVLLGLGVRQLSMNALSVPQVKRIIRAGSATVARALAARALALGTSEQVEAEIMETMEDLYPDLHLSSADELDEDTIF